MGSCCSSRSGIVRNGSRRTNRVHDLESSRSIAQSTSEEKDPKRHVSRNDADDLLMSATPGNYLFSYDVTLELFISVRCEQYVSHHAISKSPAGLTIGGELFNSMREIVNFYKNHSIGDTLLTNEFTTPESSVKKERNTKLSYKSETSSQLNNYSSSEYSSETVANAEAKVTKVSEQKHDVVAVEEERVSEFEDKEEDEVLPLKKIDKEVMNERLQSVSSAGDKDFPIDEPLPILPDPTGSRPPPLIPFSKSQFRHDGRLNADEVNKHMKDLFIMTKMIKVIVSASVDEDEEWLNEVLAEMSQLCSTYGFSCDVTFHERTSVGQESKLWEMEKEKSCLSGMEIDFLKRFEIPVLFVSVTTDKPEVGVLGPPTIPRKLSKQDFNKFSETKEFSDLRNFYSCDENDTNHPYVLKRDVEDDTEKWKQLQELSLKLLARCFEGEPDLWEYFTPEIERSIGFLMKNLNIVDFLMISKTSEKHERNINDTSKEYGRESSNNNNHDGNLHYRLIKEKNCLLKLKENGKIKESDIIEIKGAEKGSDKNVSLNVLPLVREKLLKMMKTSQLKFMASDFLENEIFSQMIETQEILRSYHPREDEMRTIKAYLECPYLKPLILYGNETVTSLIAKTSQAAFELFGENACIITRFIGLTEDSNSLHLLLRSICLQLSYAYNTDPASVPQDLSELVHFLPSMFRFATDSQPMIICLAGVSEIEVYSKEFECFNILPTSLSENVKIIVSLHEDAIPRAQKIYKDKNSYKRIGKETLEDAIEEIDSLLVSANKTISEDQKKLVLESLTKNSTSLGVQILFDVVVQWRSFDSVQLTKMDSLESMIDHIFCEAEQKFGKTFVEITSTLITVSKFGITHRCLENVLSKPLTEAESKWPSKGKLNKTISGLLHQFSRLVKRKWIHQNLYYYWSHPGISAVAKQRYNDSISQHAMQGMIKFFIDEPNKYIIRDLGMSEAASQREATPLQQARMRRQPSTESLINAIAFNWEKLHMLPYVLIRSRDIERLKEAALCDFDFLFDKLRASSVTHILDNLNHMLGLETQDIVLKIIAELFELSVEALTFDAEQFPAQITARILPDQREGFRKARKKSGSREDASPPLKSRYHPPPDGKDSTDSERSSATITQEDESEEDRVELNENEPNSDGNDRGQSKLHVKNNVENGSGELLPEPANNKSENGSSKVDSNHIQQQKQNSSNKQQQQQPDTDSVILDSAPSQSYESKYLTSLLNSAVKAGHPLMPSVRCLIRPPSDCGVFPENQISSFWQANDTRILFIEKTPTNFVTWSVKKQSILLFDSKCRLLKSHQGIKIKRVLQAKSFNLLLQLQNGTFHIYDVMEGEVVTSLDPSLRYFAVCDNSHIAAMSLDWRCLSVYNTRANQVIWKFHAPDEGIFQNVLVSRNGKIAACIAEGPNPFSPNPEDENANLPAESKIAIVNLKNKQFLHSINLKDRAIFNEICAISEDGHFFVQLKEPGCQIVVWDLLEGSFLYEIDARLHRVIKIMTSSQGNCILSVSADSILRVWNLSDGELRFSLSEPISSIRGGYMDDTQCMSMSKDGRLAVHSLKSRFHCSYVVLWDLVLGKQMATFNTDFYCLSYEISPDGKYVASCMPSSMTTLTINENCHRNKQIP